MKKTAAIVVKATSKDGGDSKYFAFSKQYPAAAVSADNLKDLFDRLKAALADVITQDEFDYTIEKMTA